MTLWFPIGGLAAFVLALVLGGGFLLYAIGSLGEAALGPEARIDHATLPIQRVAGPFDRSEILVLGDFDIKMVADWSDRSGYALGFRVGRGDIIPFIFLKDIDKRLTDIKLTDDSSVFKTRLSDLISNHDVEFFELTRAQVSALLDSDGVLIINNQYIRLPQSRNVSRLMRPDLMEKML